MTVIYNWDKLRSSFGRFTQKQVDGLNAVLDAGNKAGLSKAHIAYMLATAWHETAKTMQPIREYGKGRGRRYGTNIDIDGSRYQGLLHIYYGRGYVQLTWLTNYKIMGKLLGVDLVNNPDLALDHKIAADIMVLGMTQGRFTGKKLSDYIKHGARAEFIQARRIINGMDKAGLIADYAVKFMSALEWCHG